MDRLKMIRFYGLNDFIQKKLPGYLLKLKIPFQIIQFRLGLSNKSKITFKSSVYKNAKAHKMMKMKNRKNGKEIIGATCYSKF